MNPSSEPRQSRRELCRSALRYAALGSITLFAGKLIGRGIGATVTRGGCQQTVACRQCSGLADCGLPQATAARMQGERP